MLDSSLCAVVKVLGWLLCRLPPSVCVRLGEGFGELTYWLQPKRVRVGLRNLKAAYGERMTPAEARRIVHRIFRNLGAGLVEMLRLPAMDEAYVDRYVEIVGQPHFAAAVRSGRPVMLLTGHFGNWELSSIVAALKGYPIVALARAQNKLPRLYQLLVSSRESKGCHIVHKGGAMRQLMQAIERHEPIGIVGDQASRRGLPVNFLGRPALFAQGPFELARSRGALIVPAFVHRVQGPHHRLVIEPPIDLSQQPGSTDEVVRAGIERFAAVLARHIEQDPSQWLWLHKRWKHTPARRVVVLSDGKRGHVKQSLTVVRALKEHSASVREQVVDVRYRRGGRALALLWARLMPGRLASLACLRWALQPACFRRAASCYADVIVSCGASTAPVNLLLAHETGAKSVVIMNPAPLRLRDFALAFVPVHDELRGRLNVVPTYGALGVVDDETMTTARDHLKARAGFRAPPNGIERRRSMRADVIRRPPLDRPIIAVFIGGDTKAYRMTAGFVEALIAQVLAVCEELDGACLVTTSRRTSPEVDQLLDRRLGKHSRCWLLVQGSRDTLNGTIEGMLGWADIAVVTGESVSMVSEACASGRAVIALEPPRRRGNAVGATKPQRFLRTLVEQGYARSHPLPELGHAIQRCLADQQPVNRLNTYAVVKDAVKRLL